MLSCAFATRLVHVGAPSFRATLTGIISALHAEVRLGRSVHVAVVSASGACRDRLPAIALPPSSLRMAEAIDEPDSEWVQLSFRGRRQILSHMGTGERFDTSALGGGAVPCSLYFASDGTGVLVKGDEQYLTSDLLQESLKQIKIDCEVKRIIVRKSGATELYDKVQWKRVSRCVLLGRPRCATEFKSEVYVYNCRAGLGFVWWCVPWVRKFLFPDEQTDNWVGRKAPLWSSWLRKVGFDDADDHLMPSQHAAKKQLQLRGVSVGACQQHPQEWSLSTAMLLAMCMHCSRIQKRKGDDSIGQRADWLLHIILEKFTQGTMFALCLLPSSEGLLVEDGNIDRSRLLEEGKEAAVLCQRCGGGKKLDEPVRLVDILFVAYEALMRPSRERSLTPEVCRHILKSCLVAISGQVDMSTGESLWMKASPLALRPNPREKRVERVSLAFKEALAQQVAENPRIRSTAQILAADAALCKAEGKSAPSYDPSNQYKMRQDSMYQYFTACRASHENVDRLHLSIDGLRVGGEETMPPIFWAPQLDLMSFGPPQVEIGFRTVLFYGSVEREGAC